MAAAPDPSSASPHSSASTSGDPALTHPPTDCPFCLISATYAPYDPLHPPSPFSAQLSPEATSPAPPCFPILSTPLLIGFLDIMPLSQGHVLLCPRAHSPKLTDVSRDEAAALGSYLRVVSAAVARATGTEDWNVVQNNGAAAAQVVMHVHFHVIPRPDLNAQGTRAERFTSTMFGRGQREDLDEDEAATLAEGIRQAVAEILAEEEDGGGPLGPKL